MPLTDMLPSYKQSLQHVQHRIIELEQLREDAKRAYRWHDAGVYSSRIIALEDTAVYLVGMIREIERHG